MDKIIATSINNHKEALMFLENNIALLKDIATAFCNCLKTGGKVIFMGNGGSAADAQHLAAELVGRFKKNRRALPSIALSVNTSVITSIGNDYGFEKVFSRQVEGLASNEDIVVGISTSGNSPNIIKAIEVAKKMNIKTVSFSGKDGGKLASYADIAFTVPVTDTPRIQEIHILAGHILCEIVEDLFFPLSKAGQ